MSKSTLNDLIWTNTEKVLNQNQEQILKNISSLSKAIQPNGDLDQLFFNFYVSAVQTGVFASMEALTALGLLPENLS